MRADGNAACSDTEPEERSAEEVLVKSLCLLVMCLAVPFHAQAQVPPSISAGSQVSFNDGPATATAPGDTPTVTFRSGVDLVALNVVVTDSAEKFVTSASKL